MWEFLKDDVMSVKGLNVLLSLVDSVLSVETMEILDDSAKPWTTCKAEVGYIEETSKNKLDIESIPPYQPPPPQASPQSHTPKTHEHALPDYCWRTSPGESGG